MINTLPPITTPQDLPDLVNQLNLRLQEITLQLSALQGTDSLSPELSSSLDLQNNRIKRVLPSSTLSDAVTVDTQRRKGIYRSRSQFMPIIQSLTVTHDARVVDPKTAGQVVNLRYLNRVLPQPSNTVVTEQAFNQSSSAGSAVTYSRGDHTHGTPPYGIDDIRINMGSIDRPGISDPTYQDWQPGGSGTTFKVLKFDANQWGCFTVQLPHSYVAGTNILVHVHWTPGNRGTTEGTHTVAWKIDYTWANIEGVFGASATADCTDACQSTNDQHLMSPEVSLTGTSKSYSSMLMCRIYRDAGDTWAGSGANGPALLEIDFHFQAGSLGTPVP